MTATPQCPICRKPPTTRFTPFCSRRCADVDLGRWFGEVYRVPTSETDDDALPTANDEDDDFTG